MHESPHVAADAFVRPLFRNPSLVPKPSPDECVRAYVVYFVAGAVFT
jgi:hypothetical protein